MTLPLHDDDDCIFNPVIMKHVLNASCVIDISSNEGRDIHAQETSFLNMIYATYALIYEEGVEEEKSSLASL